MGTGSFTGGEAGRSNLEEVRGTDSFRGGERDRLI